MKITEPLPRKKKSTPQGPASVSAARPAAAAALAHAQSAAAAASSPVTLLRRNEPTQGYAQGGGSVAAARVSLASMHHE